MNTNRQKTLFKAGVVLYLQSLQLLQILEGASLNDADLVVFQMSRTKKQQGSRVSWARNSHMRPLVMQSGSLSPLRHPLYPSNWNGCGRTRKLTSQLGVTVTRVSPPAHFYLTDWFPCLYFKNVLSKCPPSTAGCCTEKEEVKAAS